MNDDAARAESPGEPARPGGTRGSKGQCGWEGVEFGENLLEPPMPSWGDAMESDLVNPLVDLPGQGVPEAPTNLILRISSVTFVSSSEAARPELVEEGSGVAVGLVG